MRENAPVPDGAGAFFFWPDKEGSDGEYNVHRASTARDTRARSGRAGPLRRVYKEIPGGRARRSQNAEASPAFRDLRPAPGRRPDAADQVPRGNSDFRSAYPP